MPNQRAENQTVVAVWLDAEYLDAVDKARKIKGLDRSSFIREAIADKLKYLQVPYKEEHVHAPDRTRPRPPGKPVRYKISSKRPSAAAEVLKRAAAGAKNQTK